MREGRPLSLLVRNLRYTTSPDRVRRFFEQFGVVRDVYLPLDFYTKLPRGFGFVEFTCHRDAEAALQALSRYATLDGAEISVTVAQQGRKSPDSMKRRERVNHQSGRQSHTHYEETGSRRRRTRGDSKGDYHDRSYRSRSRSPDERRHSHRGARPAPRWSPGHHSYGVMRREVGSRHVSRHSGSSYSPDMMSHHERRRAAPRPHPSRKHTSRSSSAPLTTYPSLKPSSSSSSPPPPQDTLPRPRHLSVERKPTNSPQQDTLSGPCYCDDPDATQVVATTHVRDVDSPSRYTTVNNNNSHASPHVPGNENHECHVVHAMNDSEPFQSARFGNHLDEKESAS